jgi:hypothetical protein
MPAMITDMACKPPRIIAGAARSYGFCMLNLTALALA